MRGRLERLAVLDTTMASWRQHQQQEEERVQQSGQHPQQQQHHQQQQASMFAANGSLRPSFSEPLYSGPKRPLDSSSGSSSSIAGGGGGCVGGSGGVAWRPSAQPAFSTAALADLGLALGVQVSEIDF